MRGWQKLLFSGRTLELSPQITEVLEPNPGQGKAACDRAQGPELHPPTGWAGQT